MTAACGFLRGACGWFFLSLALYVACFSAPVAQAAEPNGSAEPLLVEWTLDNLPAGWWVGFEKLDPENKQKTLDMIRARVERELARTPAQLVIEDEVRLIRKTLERLGALLKDDARAEDPPALQTQYSLDGWLKAYADWRVLQAKVTTKQREHDQLSVSLKVLKQELSTLFVSYRKTADPAERWMQAVYILRQQLAFLVNQELLGKLRQSSKLLGSHLSTLTATLASAAESIKPTEEERERIRKEWEKTVKSQEVLTTQIKRLELKQISEDATSPAQVLALLQKETELRLSQLVQLRLELLLAYADILENKPPRVETDWEGQITGLRTQQAFEREKLRGVLDQLSQGIAGAGDLGAVSPGIAEKLWIQAQKARIELNKADLLLQDVDYLYGYYRKKSQSQASGWALMQGLFDSSFRSSIDATLTVIYYPLFTVNETPVTAIDITRVCLILFVAMFISRMVRKALAHMGQNFGSFSEASLFAISKMLHYLILLMALIFGLSSIGLDFTNLALVAGALSVGIGFGLQSIFNNFISGLILLIERPLKVGDVVELESGVRGRIKAINVRSTQLTTRDNIDILVPNSEFISGRVINYTLDDVTRRLHIPFGVAYGSDKDLVKKAVQEAALTIPYTLSGGNREVEVRLVAFGASSLDFELVVWIDNNRLPKQLSIHAIYLWEIETQFRRYHIEIPFPQQDLYIRSVPEGFMAAPKGGPA